MNKFLFFACIYFFVSIYTYGQDKTQTFTPSDVISVPVFSSEIKRNLGNACDRNFSFRDANGNQFKAFAKGSVHREAEQRYLSTYSFKEISNEFELNATLKLFGISIGAQSQNNNQRRYAMLSVYFADSSETYEPEGESVVSGGEFYVSRVYYGWAIHYLVYSDASYLTSDFRAVFEKAFSKLANVKFKEMASFMKLESSLQIIGLEPINDGAVVLSSNEVEGKFRRRGNSKPILAEYKPLRNVQVGSIEWASNNVVPGNYRIDYIEFEMGSTKAATGGLWDAGIGKSTNPDPAVTIFLDGEAIDYKTERDSDTRSSINFKFNTTIKITESSNIVVFIEDKDALENDFIGRGFISFKELTKQSTMTSIRINDLRTFKGEPNSLTSLSMKLTRMD
jgi:hypothetical protein